MISAQLKICGFPQWARQKCMWNGKCYPYSIPSVYVDWAMVHLILTVISHGFLFSSVVCSSLAKWNRNSLRSHVIQTIYRHIHRTHTRTHSQNYTQTRIHHVKSLVTLESCMTNLARYQTAQTEAHDSNVFLPFFICEQQWTSYTYLALVNVNLSKCKYILTEGMMPSALDWNVEWTQNWTTNMACLGFCVLGYLIMVHKFFLVLCNHAIDESMEYNNNKSTIFALAQGTCVCFSAFDH